MSTCWVLQALISTTGFPEGAGVQNELPGIVRRLGTLGGVSTAFDWKPQSPEKITHLICSNKLTVSVAVLLGQIYCRFCGLVKLWTR